MPTWALGEGVAWPRLGVRRRRHCSKRPPCQAGAWWLPGQLCRHGPCHKPESLFFIQARKMQVFLPDMMEVLQDGNQDLKRKALAVF